MWMTENRFFLNQQTSSLLVCDWWSYFQYILLLGIYFYCSFWDWGKHCWLSTHLEPIEKVEDLWSLTRERRKSFLKEKTILSYIQMFPCLRTKLALELVSNRVIYSTVFFFHVVIVLSLKVRVSRCLHVKFFRPSHFILFSRVIT